MLRLIGAAVGIVILLGMFIELRWSPEADKYIPKAEKAFIPKKQIRKPASVPANERESIQPVNLAPKISERRNLAPQVPFEEERSLPEISSGEEVFAGESDFSGTSTASSGTARRVRAGSSSPSTFPERSPSSVISSSPGDEGQKVISAGVPGAYDVISPAPAPGPVPADTTPGGPSTLRCASNYGTGAYNHPIGVTINCSSAAEIRYCIGVGTCCDPETSDLLYTGEFTVGAQEGQYCLSFVGENAMARSSVMRVTFDVNHVYPHMEVTHPRTTYQTTELAGISYLASNDFSKENYYIGQINLKSHDPGPDGNDLTCEQIMNDYSSFTSPLVSMTLALYDMMGLSPSQQIEVPLNLTQLVYGANHITSYVVNQNYVSPLYSCSTTKVVLNDFEYYQVESVHREIGTGGVQEFTGGFQAYGFIDEDADEAMRAPASVSGEADLETGMVEIFY